MVAFFAMNLFYLIAAAVGWGLLRKGDRQSAQTVTPNLDLTLAIVLFTPGIYLSGHAIVPMFAFFACIAHLAFAPVFSTTFFAWQLLSSVGCILAAWLVVWAYRWVRFNSRRGAA